MSPRLTALLERARYVVMTDEEIEEQRISFAWGLMYDMPQVTIDDVRQASRALRHAQKGQ